MNEDGSDFARTIVQQIRSASPTALKISHALLKKGSQKNLKDCVKMEYRLILNHSTHYSDFVEGKIENFLKIVFVLVVRIIFSGIRAILIDKDQNPQWKPATLEEVSDDDIEKLFLPIPEGFELPTHREILFL